MHSKQLQSIFKQLAPAIQSNPVLPILENVCIRSGKAIATNLSLTISMNCDLPDMLLPFAATRNILNVIDGELIVKNNKEGVSLQCNKDVFKLGAAEDISAFPISQPITGEQYEVGEDFFYAVEQAAKNEDQNELSQLQGFCIRPSYIAATDRFVLYYYELATGIPESHLPASFVKAIAGWQTGTVQTDGNHFNCSNDNISVDVKLIDLKYPDITILLPKDFKPNCIIDRALFESALRKAQAFESGNIILTFDSIGGGIDIYYRNDFERTAAIPCEAEHSLEMEVSFNGSYLLRILSCLPDECTVLEMQFNERSASYIVYKNITLLIMPLQK